MDRSPRTGRRNVLYLAPWLDIGGSDKGTIDWFRHLPGDRFQSFLATTQPSRNRRLVEVEPYAAEIWPLPDLMPAEDMPAAIFDLICSRRIDLVHIMNSRLGFQLLPDLAFLPHPPAVVVQLHVEETDRSGYVRYVTTRYGNLVDCFSVTSDHLAEAVRGYGIPSSRIEVIHTGVDCMTEFNPDLVVPIERSLGEGFNILYPARLTAQKDPLLMVDAAAALRQRGVDFTVHVLGEGELEAEVRGRVAELGLTDQVRLHPPTTEPQRWYAACDAVLMTSAYEGVPYVLFEAMSMSMPAVAPDLPGNRELTGDSTVLVAPQDGAEGYASALQRIVADPSAAASRAAAMRDRVRERFSCERMGSDHARLYDEILGERPPASVPAGEEPDSRAGVPATMAFLDRPLTGTPLVTIVIPHFNQLGFLEECIASVRDQTYPNLEVVVVDDASSEPGVERYLDSLAAEDGYTVIRQTENGGPSSARNAGVDAARGRYLLPVDADNLLLPDAVGDLVEQLSLASEEVGFIYPNIQYFGNREDYFEAPDYNVYELLHSNYCDTCSLFDRAVFDAGLRYPEGPEVGHEDWAFVLLLATRGIRGERAARPTVRYRKWGFNRSDLIEHTQAADEKLVGRLTASLDPGGVLKAREAPALSLAPIERVAAGSIGGQTLWKRLGEQTCFDFELIARLDERWPEERSAPVVRRIPPELSAAPGDQVRDAVLAARGDLIAVTAASAADLLSDRALIEKLLRRFAATASPVDAIAFVRSPEATAFPFELLTDSVPASPHSVVWKRDIEQRLPSGLHVDPDDPLASLVRLWSGAGLVVEWRHLRAGGPIIAARETAPDAIRLERLRALPAPRQSPANRSRRIPQLPGRSAYDVSRWAQDPSWKPPLSVLVYRCRDQFGGGRMLTSGSMPAGFSPEWSLGAFLQEGPAGSRCLVRTPEGYRVLEPGGLSELSGEVEEIGYVENVALPQLGAIARAVHKETREETIVTLADDPLLPEVDVLETLGYVEGAPPHPRQIPAVEPRLGLRGLLMSVDRPAGRHRYAIGAPPAGELVGELGGLAESALQGSIPAWIWDGMLVTEGHSPPVGKVRTTSAGRWIGEPLRSRQSVGRKIWAREIASRSLAAVGRLARSPGPLPAAATALTPAGWLFESHGPGRIPLYASYHPVTRDQLLSNSVHEGILMGYEPAQLVGFLRLAAPVTGTRLRRQGPVPWARRFGAVR